LLSLRIAAGVRPGGRRRLPVREPHRGCAEGRPMLMNILLWCLFGLIAGAAAKFIMPGKDPGGIIVTILLGIAGAVGGGFASSKLRNWDVTGFNLPSFGIAVAGALLVLFLYRLFTGSAKSVA